MKTPTAYEVEQLLHIAELQYDPVKAHQYYEEHKHLKGRKKGSAQVPGPKRTRREIAKDARAKQRKELATAIHNLEQKLSKLEALIKKRTHEEKSDNRKSKAKKERAAKEKEKPKSAAEKAKIARDNAKYRDKNQQKLKTKAKQDNKSGGSSSSKDKKSGSKKHSVDELKTLATKVRGQIQVAKQKLAAL